MPRGKHVRLGFMGRVFGASCLVVMAACAAPAPRWPGAGPPALPSAGPRVAPEAVRLSFARFPWHHTAGSPFAFPVYVSAPGGNPVLGAAEVVGPVRSPDQRVDAAMMSGLYCGWGPGRDDCASTALVRRGRPVVVAALGGLRDDAAAAGAGAVREVRCFARRDGAGDGGRVWCEGEAVALAADAPPAAPSPEPAIEAWPEPAPSRWSLGASATGGVFGGTLVLGTTLHMRYRAGELAFHMVSPMDQSAAALGFELLGRRRDIGFGADLVFGVTGLAITPLGAGGEADEAATEWGLMPVLGVGWRPDLTFFGGYGQPFIDLRGGWLFATGDDHFPTGPTLELVVGLTTP
jgi:hypothetical protein